MEVSGASVDLTSCIIYKQNIFLKKLCITPAPGALPAADASDSEAAESSTAPEHCLISSLTGIPDESLIVWMHKKAFR